MNKKEQMISAAQIGQRIRRLREKACLTQSELAAACGRKHYAPLSDIERGKHYPSIPVLMQICQVLNCTPNDLLVNDDTWQAAQEKIEEIRTQLLEVETALKNINT